MVEKPESKNHGKIKNEAKRISDNQKPYKRDIHAKLFGIHKGYYKAVHGHTRTAWVYAKT